MMIYVFKQTNQKNVEDRYEISIMNKNHRIVKCKIWNPQKIHGQTVWQYSDTEEILLETSPVAVIWKISKPNH